MEGQGAGWSGAPFLSFWYAIPAINVLLVQRTGQYHRTCTTDGVKTHEFERQLIDAFWR